MPPAFVLSQDQTLKLMSQHHAAQLLSQSLTTQHRTSGADTCIFKRNGYEGHTSSAYFKLVSGAQRPPEPGAVAHMSLHLNHNVKEPPTNSGGQSSFPGFTRGGACPSMLWRPPRLVRNSRPHRCCEMAYMDAPTSGQRQSAFIL